MFFIPCLEKFVIYKLFQTVRHQVFETVEDLFKNHFNSMSCKHFSPNIEQDQISSEKLKYTPFITGYSN